MLRSVSPPPLDSIECCTFCTEVLRPTHLSLLYSRCAVLYDYHPALHCHLRDRRPQNLLVFLFLSYLAREEHAIFGSSACPSICLFYNRRADN
jgi:hypothetical protein